MSHGRDEHGYTLAELMAVLAIIGFLVLIAVASFSLASGRAQAVTCMANRRTMTRALEVYSANQGAYPAVIGDIQPYVSNWNSASKCPKGPALTYDTTSHVIACPIHGQ